MKQVLTFLIILSVVFLYSQKSRVHNLPKKNDGYSINIKTENLAGKTIKLSIYNGSYKQTYKIDSIIVKTNKENITFKQKQRIIPLIYQIAISGRPEKTDIFVNNGTVLNFVLNADNASQLTANDILNNAFINYQKLPISEEKNIELKKIQSKFPQNEALKIFTLLELRKTFKKPNNVSGLVFRKNLLNDLDLNNKAIQLMPNSYTFLNNFFSALPIDNVNYKAGVDLLLDNQNCNNNNFKFYVEWIFKNLELHQVQNMNETAQYVFNKYVNNKTCVDKQKTFYDFTFNKLSSFTKLPIGSDMPEFEMKKMNNSFFKFSDFKKEKVNVIMFYDPLCEICQKDVPKITKEIEDLEKETNQKIGKIAVLNGNNTLWKGFLEKNNLMNWENVTYKDGDFKTQEYLDAFSNPKYYIIDQNGKIMIKNYSYSFLRNQILK